MKIFWSWQDDSPGKTNRHFIKEALSEAIEAIGEDYEAEDAERPELDHDTKGVSGAKEIVPTLMAKIAGSVAFVADVTPIGQTTKGKALPNPNVMVELGWSLNKPGDGQQIYVLNTADGWTIEQLPFDIRHRRVLTYSLAITADRKIRDRVKKELVGDLTGAVKDILNQHLEEKAQSTPAVGVEAKAGEPSIWVGGEAGFQHMDGTSQGRWQQVTIPAGARAYLRVIPTGWKSKPPTATQIRALNMNVLPLAPARGMGSGDFGITKEGYVNYWVKQQPGPEIHSENVSMFFDKTGEFWILHGSAVTEGTNRHFLSLDRIFKGWATALRRSHWLFDHFGALPARRVEIGLTGIGDVTCPTAWNMTSQSRPRFDAWKLDKTQRTWSEPTVQEAFLIQAFNGIFELYGLNQRPVSEAQSFIAHQDPERGTANPYN